MILKNQVVTDGKNQVVCRPDFAFIVMSSSRASVRNTCVSMHERKGGSERADDGGRGEGGRECYGMGLVGPPRGAGGGGRLVRVCFAFLSFRRSCVLQGEELD